MLIAANNPSLSPAEAQLLAAFRATDDWGRERITNTARGQVRWVQENGRDTVVRAPATKPKPHLALVKSAKG